MKPSLRQEIRHLLAMGYEQRGQEWVPIPFYRGLWQWLARKKWKPRTAERAVRIPKRTTEG